MVPGSGHPAPVIYSSFNLPIMKQSFLLFTFFLLTLQLSAQIVLNRSDYNLTSDGMTINSWSMSTAGFSVPEVGTNMTWDFSAQALVDPFTYSKDPVSGNPDLPEANLVEKTSDRLLGIIDIPVDLYERVDDGGLATVGRVFSTVGFPSMPITGGANDSITIVGYTNVYEEPDYFFKFPMTYQDAWEASYTVQINYLMKVAAFGLDNVPASQVSRITQNTSVAGHGTLILPNPGGSGSVSIEALLLRRDRVQTDSFLLAGQPAPSAMLGALGLMQGSSATTTQFIFCAKGLPRSAVNVSVRNGAVTFISMSDDVKDLVSSSRFVAPELATVRVFPNPTNGEFQVAFDKTDAQNWTLQVLNPLGQQIQSAILGGHPGEQLVNVSLPDGTQTGLYQIVVRNSQNVAVSTGRVFKN